MKGSDFICLFFTFYAISSKHSSASPSNVLGMAVCHAWGQMQSECNGKNIQPDKFPKDCSAISYGNLDLTDSTIVDYNEGKVPDGYLDTLGANNKPVIVIVVRDSWHEDVKKFAQKDGSTKELKSWKEYLDKHPVIKGLVFLGVELQIDDEEDPDYTQNLIAYIDIMKKNFPQLIIGLYVLTSRVINTSDTPQLKSLDLAKLNSCVDFFMVFSATDHEVLQCTMEYIHGDTDLINEFMNISQNYIEAFKIPKEKVLYDIYGAGTNANLGECDLMYPALCSKPNQTFCADTQINFYQKALYYKNYAGGFVLKHIDWDDANSVCQCGRAYPLFYALWDGFNGFPEPKECALFDRPNL